MESVKALVAKLFGWRAVAAEQDLQEAHFELVHLSLLVGMALVVAVFLYWKWLPRYDLLYVICPPETSFNVQQYHLEDGKLSPPYPQHSRFFVYHVHTGKNEQVFTPEKFHLSSPELSPDGFEIVKEPSSSADPKQPFHVWLRKRNGYLKSAVELGANVPLAESDRFGHFGWLMTPP